MHRTSTVILVLYIDIHHCHSDIHTSLSIDFCSTNCEQVETVLKEVNVSKSNGHEMIPRRLITGAQPKAGTGHKMRTISFPQRCIVRDISLT